VFNRPVHVTLVFLDAGEKARARAWLPDRWIVEYRTLELVLHQRSPLGVIVTDSPEALNCAMRRNRSDGIGILWTGKRVEFWGAEGAEQPLRSLACTATNLVAGVISQELRRREAVLLGLLGSDRRRVGATVTKFVRQLLLEPIPDAELVLARRRGGDQVYLRSAEDYSAAQGSSLRHRQASLWRLGITPSYLRDLVLLRAILEVRLTSKTLRGVARQVGLSSEDAVSRFVRRVAKVPYAQLDDEAALEALAELGQCLGLGGGEEESAS
jgi:hypothetical protein